MKLWKQSRWGVLLALVCVLGSGCSNQEANAVAVLESNQKVEITTPHIGEIVDPFSTVGRIEGSKSLKVTSPLSSTVKTIEVKIGEMVKKGQVLFKVKSDENLKTLELQVMRAETDYNSTLKNHQSVVENYDRIEKLYQTGASSKADYEVSKLQYDQSVMQLEVSRKAMQNAKESYQLTKGRYTVTSPIEGEVVKLEMETGQQMDGSQYIKISSNQQKVIKVGIPEKLINHIEVGTQGKARIPVLEETYDLRVSEISKDIEPSTGLYPVKLSIESDDSRIVEGLFGEVRLDAKTLENQVLIPLKTVLFSGEQPYVYVIRESVAKKNDIDMGIIEGEYIQVLQGLTGDETIVITGQELLTSNEKVDIVKP